MTLGRLVPVAFHDLNAGGAYVHPSRSRELLRSSQDRLAFDPDPARAPARAEAGAGLVSSKTSLIEPGDSALVSFGASVQAQARIARLKKSVWASGHLHKLADKGHRPPVAWFVTLTYRGVDDWRADHMSQAVQAYREWCRRRRVPCRYTWVAELQQRGAVHYHLLAWLPVGVRMPMWDRATACARTSRNPRGRVAPFWPYGMTERAEARAGVGYLMKYLSKLGEFHRFPKGLRLYGIGGLQAEGRAVRSWINLPQWCKALHGVGEVMRAAGRLVVRATGEVLASPYRVRLVPGGLLVQLVGELAPRWFAGPYSALPDRAGVN